MWGVCGPSTVAMQHFVRACMHNTYMMLYMYIVIIIIVITTVAFPHITLLLMLNFASCWLFHLGGDFS